MNTATPFLLAAIAAALVASCGGEDPASELIVDRADASMPDADAAVAVPLQDGGIADHASSDSRLNPANGSDAQPDVVDAAIEGAHEDASDGNDAGTPFPTYPPVPYPLENPPSDAKAVLGKILFWDEQLSSDDTVACGTCHRAGSGGSDPRAVEGASRHPGPDGLLGTVDDVHGGRGIVRCQIVAGAPSYIGDSVFGFAPQVTRRKPPTYLDAMYFPDLFWDGRAKGQFIDPDTGQVAIASGGALESQAVGPPLSDAEMACEVRTWADIHTKLQGVVPLALATDLPSDIIAVLTPGTTYPDLFEAAFGTRDITTQRIAFAIATHERRLTSDQTRWDRWNAGEQTAMTAAQISGFELFMNKARCNVCHPPPLFTDLGFHNLGIELSSFDTGLQEVTTLPADRGRFKTPTVRNAGLREPGGLLHSGSRHGATMDTLMAAYDFPPNEDPNTDPEMKILGLTSEEAAQIVDFLRKGLTDPRARDEMPPFDRPKLRTEP